MYQMQNEGSWEEKRMRHKKAFYVSGFKCVLSVIIFYCPRSFFIFTLNLFSPSVRYLDNKVFVSLANGEVIVYQREAGKLRCRHD